MSGNRTKVRVVTMGCSKNRVDSEHLLAQLESAGFAVSREEDDLESDRPDILIINTCGFIHDAKQESVNAILEGVDAKEREVIRKLYVTGCLSQRYPQELKKEIPQVDGYFGTGDTDALLDALSVPFDSSLDTARCLTTPGHYAYLKISEGCDRKCSYCAIPLIRGPHVSRPVGKLIEEAAGLAAKGVRELIVVAQDTTYYGLDLYGSRKLAGLLDSLSGIDGIDWIRLHYSYPASFPDDVLELMSGSDRICRYLDIPLQHISDNVLRAMRRSIDGNATRKLVEKIRRTVPGIVLRTTMMVGHPGEGRTEFMELLDFVREYRFERLGAFTYSEEDGTWGQRNLADTVSPRTKQRRYDRLMELQAAISLAYDESRIGTVEQVIIDSYCPEEQVCYARSAFESPEVDGNVIVRNIPDGAAVVGTFIKVRITGADEYDLYAEPVDDEQ